MWRNCDLHIHTTPNEQDNTEWDPAAFVRSSLDNQLAVVAVTDHDTVDHVHDVLRAAEGTPLEIIPGCEITTDRGHVVVLAPGEDGLDLLREYLQRVGVSPASPVALRRLIDDARTACSDGSPFSRHLVLVGAHVDQSGSLLGSGSPVPLDDQLLSALQLHAIEVTRDETIAEWLSGGVKQRSDLKLCLIRSSDSHSPVLRTRSTWLYLPEVNARAMQHAFATPESSVRFETPPTQPEYAVLSVHFDGTLLHDGQSFDFCDRTNAIVGAPNSGKSLIVDAIKWVFAIESGIDEVDSLCDARLAACLPDGSTVTVTARTPDGEKTYRRQRGGSEKPTVDFAPIAFSQTELTRRAMDPTPSMNLLDIHAPEVGALEESAARMTIEITDAYIETRDFALVAATVETEISNPQDGLAATKVVLDEFAGTEELTKTATDVARVKAWRLDLEEKVETWLQDLPKPSSPTIPQLPTLDSDGGEEEFAPFLPRQKSIDAVGEYTTKVDAAAITLKTRITTELTDGADAFDALAQRTEEELIEAGFEESGDVAEHVDVPRQRLVYLEARQEDLKAQREMIDNGIADLLIRIGALAEVRADIRAKRKDACRRVNESMRTFFVRISEDTDTAEIDALVDEVKVGTHFQRETREEVRDKLDRSRLLEAVIRTAQGREDLLPDRSDLSKQDTIAREASRRGKVNELARLACLWPTDELLIYQKPEPDSDPKPFQDLTEGLRALAIKEISFAASNRPVISDQPEDAVPTRAVFDNLVPTLRRQRANRQFLVVSHDANVVVAGDMERVWVLQGDPTLQPYCGTLFEERVHEAALEHLEGGAQAFELRRSRYARLRT